MRRDWDSFDITRQNAIIKAVVEQVIIGPAVGRGPYFDPGRIGIRWRA